MQCVPATVVLALLVLSGMAQGQGPANDDCANPIALTGSTSVTIDNSTAVTSGFDGGGGPCGTVVEQDVFYVWTATDAGTIEFATCNSNHNGSLAIHVGSDCSATCIAQNDTPCSLGQRVHIDGVEVGDELLIQVGGGLGSFGPAGVSTLVITPTVATLGNDQCYTAQPMLGTGTVPFDTIGSSVSGFTGVGGCTVGIGQDRFFVWRAVVAGDYAFETCFSGFDSGLAVYAGGDCQATCLGFDDSSCMNGGRIEVLGVQPGDIHLIQVGGAVGYGPGILTVREILPPPTNEDCATPQVISGTGAWDLQTLDAQWSGFDGGGGACGAVVQRDLFFAWTAPASGSYAFDTCGSLFDTILRAFDGSDCSAVCLSESDDACGLGSRIELQNLQAGDPVLLQVGGYIEGGIGQLAIELIQIPVHDTCATPIPISGLGLFPFDNLGAGTSGFDGGSALCWAGLGGPPYSDVFFTWVAPATGSYDFAPCSNVEGTHEVVAHLGTDCSATCVDASSGDTCHQYATDKVARVSATAGANYLIQVGGIYWSNETDAGVLEITPAPSPPANDDCSAPAALSGTGAFPYDGTGGSDSGFSAGAGSACDLFAMDQDVFFVWTVPNDGDFTIHTNDPANWGTRLAVYAGSDCSASCVALDDNGLNSSFAHTHQSLIDLVDLVAGETFLIQLASAAPGMVFIEQRLAPANNTCQTPELIPGVGTYSFDNQMATTSGFDGGSAGTGLCYGPLALGSVLRDLFFVWTVPCSSNYRVTASPVASTAFGASKLNVHFGDDCSATCLGADSSVFLGHTNSSVELLGLDVGSSYLIQLGSWAPMVSGTGILTIENLGSPCPPGWAFIRRCTPALPNQTGNPVSIQGAVWSASSSNLHLDANGGPAGAFGFFLVASSEAAPLPIGQGLLCLGLPMGRYNGQNASNLGLPQLNSLCQFLPPNGGTLVNLGGSSSSGLGFDVPSELPAPFAPTQITSGDTWFFQFWYRDMDGAGSPDSNLSDVLEVQFP
tara:strand:- start:8574 stop:11588 length:3015 start_codon:yes stop_codon:yes gene_type:complete